MADLHLVCMNCGHKFHGPDPAHTRCPLCGSPVRRVFPLIDRWVGPPTTGEGEIHHRHMQMMTLLWSRDGRGQEYYNILRPGISYSKFLRKVTLLVCRGIVEGWIIARIPPIPSNDDEYQIEFPDPERFVDELTRLFAREGESRNSLPLAPGAAE